MRLPDRQGTVFYSWQADLPNATNRGFIQTALENALKTLSQNEAIGLEAAIDRDTSGVPGAPDIATTIFDKIENALVFVADISIINPNRSEKCRPTPNPNVLVEVGYALHCLGVSRLIFVFNTAFGTVEELPFDLRMKRVLTYHAPPENRDRATPRKGLEKTLASAIRAIWEYNDSGDDATPPPLPITTGSLYTYITGSRRVRHYDRRLAEMYDLPLDTSEGGYIWLTERLEYFGIKTIQELDETLQRWGEVAYYVGYSMRPQKKIHSGHILGMLTWVLAGQLPSDEEVLKFWQSLKYTNGGMWHELREIYQTALIYKEQAETKKRKRWIDRPQQNMELD